MQHERLAWIGLHCCNLKLRERALRWRRRQAQMCRQQRALVSAHMQLALSEPTSALTVARMSKEERERLLRAFTQALANEKRLLELTTGKPPGHPEHSPSLWTELLAAMDATHKASKAYQEESRH